MGGDEPAVGLQEPPRKCAPFGDDGQVDASPSLISDDDLAAQLTWTSSLSRTATATTAATAAATAYPDPNGGGPLETQPRSVRLTDAPVLERRVVSIVNLGIRGPTRAAIY